MRLGTLVHAAVLEPEWWARSFVVAPKVDRRTRDGKERWAAFVEESRGKTIVKPDELALVEGMARAVLEHPAARHALKVAPSRETPFFWVDPATGVECKGKADAHGPGLGLDLKTCQSAAPQAFAREIARHAYHVQASHYIDGLRSIGCTADAWAWIAVESSPPHAVAAYVASPEMLERAHETRMQALDLLCDCRANDYWPGYSDRFATIDLPAWA